MTEVTAFVSKLKSLPPTDVKEKVPKTEPEDEKADDTAEVMVTKKHFQTPEIRKLVRRLSLQCRFS